jgi:two-component system LytT family response regulator
MLEEHRILLNTTDAIYFIPVKDILYCKSDNSYTTFYLLNREPIVVSRNIKDYESQLAESGFFRPHQSYLVNMLHLRIIDKSDGFTLVLSGNKRVPTSTRKKKELLHILQKELRFQTGVRHIQI